MQSFSLPRLLRKRLDVTPRSPICSLSQLNCYQLDCVHSCGCTANQQLVSGGNASEISLHSTSTPSTYQLFACLCRLQTLTANGLADGTHQYSSMHQYSSVHQHTLYSALPALHCQLFAAERGKQMFALAYSDVKSGIALSCGAV